MLEPLALTDQLTGTYSRYLRTLFDLKTTEMRHALQDALDESTDPFHRGPFLEASPPFVAGATPHQLSSQGILSPAWQDITSIPVHRPLYQHQVEAITKVQRGRNVIVATGTGSGKTETFLYPIFDALLREREAGTLSDGVRALLLYPMNALVNDQLRRLRVLLSDWPFITFGRYTGETSETDSEGSAPVNERATRQQIRAAPPHLLITNYAMLEYLLQRPNDVPLFDGWMANSWRFVVLDEAHAYVGAKGAEVGLLLRRLKTRVGATRMQCIGTSATLGSGPDDYPAVAQFGRDLFGEPFEAQDVVGPSRQPLAERPAPWGGLRPTAYEELHQCLLNGAVVTTDDWIRWGLPSDSCRTLLSEGSAPGPLVPATLHQVLARDRHVHALQALVSDKPRELKAVIDEMRRQFNLPARDVTALVHLAVAARLEEDGPSLLPARYHVLLKATEGLYVSLYPETKMFLQPHGSYDGEDGAVPVFELGGCAHCGAEYLVGRHTEQRLEPYAPDYDSDAYVRPGFFALTPPGDVMIDADDEQEAQETSAFAHFRLCRRCGLMMPEDHMPSSACPDGTSHVFMVLTKAPVSAAGHPGCVHCGIGGGRGPRRFLTGQDAPVAVIATGLYSALQHQAAGEPVTPENVGKLLMFADSRQDAAFFAPYLETSYARIVWRRLILRAVEKAGPESWFEDVASELQELAEKAGMGSLDPDASPKQQHRKAQVALLQELVSDGAIGLERVGLLKIAAAVRGWRPPTLPHWNGSPEDTRWLLETLWRTTRLKAALELPDGVKAEDVAPYLKRMQVFHRFGAGRTMSWEPRRQGVRNARTDYVMRLGRRLGWPAQELATWAHELVSAAFTYFTDPTDRWEELLVSRAEKQVGTVHQAKWNRWEFSLVDPDSLLPCDVCGRLAAGSVLGVCPAWGCEGTMRPADEVQLADNHYRQLYEHIPLVPMTVREHTAQLERGVAQDIQMQFMRGKVSVLSTSTTFELGVDAGELESVFMRNVPPEPANYVQRAGRAGRRTSSAAVVVTYAQRRSHDLAQFYNPERFLEGRVPPPRIVLGNDKVARRHLHAIVTSWFFRRNPASFGQKGHMRDWFSDWLAGGSAEWDYHLNTLRGLLHPVPHELRQEILAVMPPEMAEALDVENDGWVDAMVGDEGVLTAVCEELHQTLEDLNAARSARPQIAGHLTHVIDTLFDESMLSCWPRSNVLPKYGFPVDLVPLRVQGESRVAKMVDLTRDLSIAVAEYAPGNQVVAAGRAWTSYGLLRDPRHIWESRSYAVCRRCGYLAISQPGLELVEPSCPTCGPDEVSRHASMIIPRLGFTTGVNQRSEPVTDQRPERRAHRRVYFSGFSEGTPEPWRYPLAHGQQLECTYSHWGLFTVLNRGLNSRGYRVCTTCGYTEQAGVNRSDPHDTPWGTQCTGDRFRMASLGHQFGTDVVRVRFPGAVVTETEALWPSVLYAIQVGAVEAAGIPARELGATLHLRYSAEGPSLVYFDAVPGGAGHVRYMAEHWEDVLAMAAERVRGQCGCGEDASCYGCLKSYDNQAVHGELKRGLAQRFLERILVQN